MLPRKLEIILSLPKSLYFNLNSLPFKDAYKVPILISRRTVLKSLKGNVRLQGDHSSFGIIRVGFSGAGTAMHMPTSIENYGTIILSPGVRFGGGCQICTENENSVLEIGENTSFTSECHIVAKKRIRIGKDCLISWNTQIMDTDMHSIVSGSNIVNGDNNVVIGNHVWIGSKVVILKGTSIADDNVIAAGAIVSGTFDRNKSCITGMPLKVIKSNIEWAR